MHLTHRVARVFTQLLLLFRGRIYHQFLKARRAEGRALLLVHDQLRYWEFGAPVRRQLRFAPRGSAGCTERMQQRLPAGAGAGSRVALISLLSFKRRRGRTAEIRLRRRDHAVQMFLFPLKHPQSRLLLAALGAPGDTSALQSHFRTEQGFGFILDIPPDSPLVGQRLLPLGAALMLRWFLLHGARAATGQPERTEERKDVTVGLLGLRGHFHRRSLEKYAQRGGLGGFFLRRIS